MARMGEGRTGEATGDGEGAASFSRRIKAQIEPGNDRYSFVCFGAL